MLFHQIGYLLYDKLSSKEDKPSETTATDETTATNNTQNELDQMSVDDLFKYALNHSEHREDIAQRYFTDKFQFPDKTFVAVSSPEVRSAIVPFDNVVMDGEDISPSIEVFGPVIRNFKLHCTEFTPSQLKQMFESINKHLAGSVVNMIFENCTEDAINLLEPTFDKVESIILTGSRFEGNKKCKLHEVFPNMKRLELELVDGTDTVCLEENFPKLEHFEFYGVFSNPHGGINKILNLNNQLTSVSLWQPMYLDFFRILSESLPNLKALELHTFNSNFFMNIFEKAEFKNVKTLRIFTDSETHRDPEKLPFVVDELEELQLSRYDLNSRWVDIIIQHKKLKSLTIDRGALTARQWQRIATKLPELKKVEAIWNRENAEGISFMMNEHDNLQRIVFSGMHMKSKEMHDVVKAVDTENWQMVHIPTIDSPDVVFQRRERIEGTNP